MIGISPRPAGREPFEKGAGRDQGEGVHNPLRTNGAIARNG